MAYNLRKRALIDRAFKNSLERVEEQKRSTAVSITLSISDILEGQ